MSSSHKPRAKNKRGNVAVTENGSKYIDPVSSATRPAFPLASFLWPARSITSQWVTLPLVLMVAGLFRWVLGLWNYSGYQSPPMHGDFEAQRHWMEITIHLPITQWYFYDLEWWGLDYPPLTAFHSYLLGKLGSYINPSWFELDVSRRLDDPALKTYMRATVVASDFLVFIPSVVILLRHLAHAQGVQAWESSVALAAVLMQPAILLIDFAHFQYNSVMLGFVVAAISSFVVGRRLWASIFFVASLGFKQMALYYAPAFFAALLSVCIFPRPRPLLLLGIAVVTLLSFLSLVVPFVAGSILYGTTEGPQTTPFALPQLIMSLPLADHFQKPSAWYYHILQQLSQMLHRIFPFARGIFEDKVANFWCVLNIFVKLRDYPVHLLQRLSLLATLVAIIPPCFLLFWNPNHATFLYTLAATAWGFFLCSFQVHEKSVLLPLMPMTLCLALQDGATPQIRAWVGWANVLGAWTMFPLLKRDELRVPYAVLVLLWSYLMGLPPTSLSAYRRGSKGNTSTVTAILHLLFYAAMASWHLVEATVATPEGKPDLWVVANVGIGAFGFGICYLWCLWQAFHSSGILSADWKKAWGERQKLKHQ